MGPICGGIKQAANLWQIDPFYCLWFSGKWASIQDDFLFNGHFAPSHECGSTGSNNGLVIEWNLNQFHQKNTPLETNSLPLKMDGWETILARGLFSRVNSLLVSRRVHMSSIRSSTYSNTSIVFELVILNDPWLRMWKNLRSKLPEDLIFDCRGDGWGPFRGTMGHGKFGDGDV